MGPGETERDVAPWPAWVRYTLLALLFAIVGTGLVVALYSRGALPIAGPFVVIFLLPLLLLLRARGLRSRTRRLSTRTAGQLRQVGAGIEREQSLGPDQRSTGATDQALAVAAGQVDTALRAFDEGRASAGTRAVGQLVQSTRSWSSQSPLSRDLARTSATAERLTRTLAQADETQRSSR
jgi:hypothetical protein